MREGDRADKRSGAHIIEDQDGKLIGSFTRLTKVKMTEFRKLLAEEQHRTVSKSETDIKSSRLLIRRTTADFYEEYPIPKGPDTQTVLRKRPVIKRPQMRKWQRELWLQRMADVDTTTTEPLSPHLLSGSSVQGRPVSTRRSQRLLCNNRLFSTSKPRKQAGNLWTETEP